MQMKTQQSFQVEIGHQHATLGRELRELEAALDFSPQEVKTEVVRRLAMVQSQLKEHFVFEEQGGYMANVLERSPNLHRVVEQLLSEHAEMAQSLAALRETTENPAGTDDLDPALRQQIRDWIAKVRQHEGRENSLVLDSCNRDMDAED